MIAVASANPMYCSEVKNSPTEPSCIIARANCMPGWRVRSKGSMAPRKISAKISRFPMNRAQMTCAG